MSVPLLLYLAFRGVTYGEALLARLTRGRGWGWLPRRHTLTIPLIVVLLVIAAPEPLYDVIDGAPGHFSATVGQEPKVPRIGYARPGENDVAAIESLDAALDSFVGPGDTVFDFSNAPGLVHYLLGFKPGTRYYHVSFAIRDRNQSDLVSQLEGSPAAAVVLGAERTFNDLPAWDGIANHVRHYDVSEHLLDEYVPVQAVAGFVLMAPRTRGLRAARELYFRADPCDWGYAPNFLAKAPQRQADAVQLRTKRSPDGKHLLLTLPPGASSFRWLEVRTGAPLANGRFVLTDRPQGDSDRTIAFSAVGRGEHVLRVNVGACPQWRGYAPGTTLYLATDVAQDVDSIRLVR
jgi:hypothetical protein